MGFMELVVNKPEGLQTFRLEPGTHTIQIDTRTTKQNAIADYLKALATRKKGHTKEADAEDIAVAIGVFDVPLSMIYGDEITEVSQLDDNILAKVIRYRIEREVPVEGPKKEENA